MRVWLIFNLSDGEPYLVENQLYHTMIVSIMDVFYCFIVIMTESTLIMRIRITALILIKKASYDKICNK